MDQLKRTLATRLNQRSLAVTATAAYVCHVAATLAAGRYQVVSYRADTLVIAAPTAGAAQDLRFDRSAILEALKQQLRGSVQVERVWVVVRPTE